MSLRLSPSTLALALAIVVSACSSDSFTPNPERGPIAKADQIGSCEGFCGEKSAGACWCDEECSYYGDCCEDKVATCDAQPTACGGFLGDTCSDDEFCSFTLSGICGWADASGVCLPKPEACTQEALPVCGCDDQTYSNECTANAAGVSISKEGPCTIFCGGFGGIQCPEGLTCVDDPNDGCDPQNGGADCGGMCVVEEKDECEPVLCELFCENGFAKDEEGCEICACEPVIADTGSCEAACGGQSEGGSCWCDDLCEQYGDCCDDFADECEASGRVAASGSCVKNSGDECVTDEDCNVGGCGAELCFNPEVSSGVSTCECSGPGVEVSGCGCVEGSCSWYNE